MIRRPKTISDVQVDTVLADAQEIMVGDYIVGMVFVPAASPLTSLTWHAAPARGGTYLPAYDVDGLPIVQAVAAGRAYPLPVDLAGCRALKAVGNADGTVHVSLKA